jgi:prefoldin subunit 5
LDTYAKIDLEEAIRSIASTLSKSEKVQLKLKEGTSQHSTIVKDIRAYTIAIEVLKKELENDTFDRAYTDEELEEVLQSISSVNNKVEKILPKFNPGTSQHTLTIRRIKAFDIATKLIGKELNHFI